MYRNWSSISSAVTLFRIKSRRRTISWGGSQSSHEWVDEFVRNMITLDPPLYFLLVVAEIAERIKNLGHAHMREPARDGLGGQSLSR